MGLRDDYERGVNDPDAPRMPWWFEHALELFAVAALIIVAAMFVFEGVA